MLFSNIQRQSSKPLVVGLMVAGIIQTSPAHAAQECRTAALPDGTPALFCKDKKGNWRQQAGEVVAAPVASSNIPVAALYADASYRGPAVWNVPVRQRVRRNRTLTDLVLNGAEPKTQREEIFVSLNMRIEGAGVTGTISGGSWLKVPISGTRKDGVCNITGTFNAISIVYVGKCDASGFIGTMTQYGGGGEALKGNFQLDAVSFTDTSERDAARAALKAKCDAGTMAACVELEQKK
jgi:hypothetical protein